MKKNHFDINTVRALHQSGQLDEAKKGYLKLLQMNPKNTDVLHSLSILCAQQEDFSEAIDYLQSAIKLQPLSGILKLHLANILKLQGLFSQAAEVLEGALQDNPDYVAALNNLGTVYFAQAKLDQAVLCYRRAIEKQPNYIDAYYNLGLALSKQNKFLEAIDTYNKLLLLAPEHFPARFHMGCILMQENNFEEASKTFLMIETAHPNHFETQTNLATCYLKLGALNEAKFHYLKALELMPNDIQILFNLGVINTQLGHIDNAIQYYQRAVQINPNDFAVHNNLGVAFLAKQHVGFALHHFQEALRIQPKNAVIQHTLQFLSQHQHLLASPPDYVKALFDSYADHYEPHLLKALDYKIPELFTQAIFAVTHPKQTNWDILDLGCGTGLCGVDFKPYAKKLIGVDLSDKMLEVAAQKNIYNELVTGDVIGFLTEKKLTFDLIIAGDILVYIGNLDKIFQEVADALRDQGLFVFNTEISNDSEFKMNQSGRFSHSKNYLDQLAEKNHLQIAYYKSDITRYQNNEPVYGHIYVLKK